MSPGESVLGISWNEDHHVHTDRSDDGHDSAAAVLAAASVRGLTRVVISDHVRADTAWVGEHVAGLRRLPTPVGVTLLVGVETKMLDSDGRLDLPARLPRLDRVLIADHQWPGPGGPVTPRLVIEALAENRLSPQAVVDELVGAMCRAVARVEGAQLAHPFSLLPKVGLSEDLVDKDHLSALSSAVLSADAVVEVNEKWRCPSGRILSALSADGVRLVASTDAHHAHEVGRYSALPIHLSKAAPERTTVASLT